jgi:hypothetical protein
MSVRPSVMPRSPWQCWARVFQPGSSQTGSVSVSISLLVPNCDIDLAADPPGRGHAREHGGCLVPLRPARLQVARPGRAPAKRAVLSEVISVVLSTI